MKAEKTRVIFDTNVWISFLIGKKMSFLTEYISNDQISVIVTDQLLLEIKMVTARDKLKKYFPQESVKELIELLETIGHNIEIEQTHFINRDPKDNFLLDLIDFSKADFLVTGDKDLLLHNPFLTAKILTPSDFEIMILKP